MRKLAVSCGPPLPDKYCSSISKGEYVSFNKLLIPKDFHHPRDSTKLKHKQPGRAITDLASWLEAWNRYMAVVLAAHPKQSLELLKYQTLICAAFAKYPAEACLEYDRCFRLQASKDSKLTWGKYKEDILSGVLLPNQPAQV